MPGARIAVFKDSVGVGNESSSELGVVKTQTRRSSPRAASSGSLGGSSKAYTNRSATLIRSNTGVPSLITTSVSTITLDDKENRDPISGLPLSMLLAPSSKSSKPPSKLQSLGLPSGQKYIATTITTTVLSPVFPESGAKVRVAGKSGLRSASAPTRIALGQVKKVDANVFEGQYSLADADTDDEKPKKKKSVKSQEKAEAKKTHHPRRSVRLAVVDGAVTEEPEELTAVSDKPAPKASSSGKSKRTASVSQSSDIPKSSSKVRKLALAKHTAAVTAAASVDAGMSEDAQPPVKKRRTSPRASSSTAASSENKTVTGGVRAFEVFNDTSELAPSLSSPTRTIQTRRSTRSSTSPTKPPLSTRIVSAPASFAPILSMDVDESAVELPANASESIQRIIDARCRELTVMPLANVSDAFSVYSESIAGSREGSVLFGDD